MMSSLRSWTAALSVIGVLLAGGPPARAADQPSTPRWQMAPCVADEVVFSGSTYDQLWNTVTGSVAQCGPTVRQGGFRIATYHADEPTGSAPGYNVRLFGSAKVGDVRAFGVAVPYIDGEFGVCVLAGANRRIRCYRVEISFHEGHFVDQVYPLATNDPLVRRAVITSPYTGEVAPNRETSGAGPRPACGTCF